MPTAIRTFNPDELLVRAMNSVHMTSAGIGGHWQPPSDAEAARLFPQYEIRGLVGRGAMGAVYRAHQVTLDRDVAIKLLPMEVSVDRAFADRFVREARAMAKLSHPNIISVYHFGTTPEGHLFFVMEFIEGSDLSQIIRSDGFTPDRALAIVAQVCMALAYAHGKGVIHRDIKPANVMVDKKGHAKLTDFGVARIEDPDGGAEATRAGAVIGTPSYMSPEQIQGQPIDRRTDIFSAGVLFYQLLTGQKPFEGTQWALAKKIIQDDPVWPSHVVQIPETIDRVVARALAKAPEHRYQKASEFAADLKRIMQGQEPQATMPPPASRPAAAAPSAAEKEFWDGVKDSDDVEEVGLYLEQFPNGFFAAQAKEKMEALKK
jgi:serine/threonine protein kinase